MALLKFCTVSSAALNTIICLKLKTRFDQAALCGTGIESRNVTFRSSRASTQGVLLLQAVRVPQPLLWGPPVPAPDGTNTTV